MYKETFKALNVCINLFILMFILTSCNSENSSSTGSIGTTKTSNKNTATSASTIIEPNAITTSQVMLGTLPCPAVVSDPAHWDAIIPTQPGTSAVKSVSCASLIGNSTIQALVKVLSDGPGNYLDIYVYDNITSANPTRLFQALRLAQGDARISKYNTILTAEVDQNSSVNKDAGGNNALQPDLFREFRWSDGAGTFVPIAFPGIFPVLTRYQAEDDQQQVSQGHQPWQVSASMTAQALAANLLKWSPDSPATITQGGGLQDVAAVVDVTNKNPDSGTIHVAMSRLYGQIGNIWIATAVTSDGLSINAPPKNERVTSPVNVNGAIQAAGDKAGTIHIFDHTQTDIGHADVQPAQGNGSVTYNATVSYNTTFKTGTQEGMVALYLPGNSGGSISAAVIVKVLLG